MTCDEALILISGSIDGQNTQQEEAALQAHLSECPECRALLQAYRDIDGNVADMNVPAPEALLPDIMERIKAEQKRKKSKPWRSVIAAAGLVAAVFAVLIGTKTIRLPNVGANKADVPAETSAKTTVGQIFADAHHETDAPMCEAVEDLPEDALLYTGSLNAPTNGVDIPAETDAPMMEATDAPTCDEVTPQDDKIVKRFKRHFISPIYFGECFRLAEENDAFVLLCDGISEETLEWLKAQNEALAEQLDDHSTLTVNEETGALTLETDYLTVMAIREYITRVLAEQTVWESPEVLENCLAELCIEYGYLEQLTELPESFLTNDLPEEWTEEFIMRWFEGGNWRYISPTVIAELTQEQVDAWLNGEMLDIAEDSLPELTDTAYLVLIPPQPEE